jgi:phosphomannomutase
VSDTRRAAEQWIEDDPDYETQQELRRLLERIDAGDKVGAFDLEERFAGTLEFGTAGLRGVLGAGPNRMNRAVVIRATHGLAVALLESFGDDAKRAGVVVGYDGRKLSREFAEDTAGVLAAHGIVAHVFTTCGPTPLTAFAVKKLGAAAGVMVTASHNPPEYNGYKVYWRNAAQIIPPIDGLIAGHIAKAPAARAVPRIDFAEARHDGLVVDVSSGVERAYLDAIRGLSVSKGGYRAMPIVYTPLHGVGNRLARQAFAEAGFTQVTTVEEQAEPDGAFPTVAFPNPEEKGAMDLAFLLGRTKGAELVLANDPDADRLAVALKDPSSPTGFHQLTGNQVGVLLGHYLLEKSKDEPKRLVIASIVSSPQLGSIAKAMGVRYEDTLTGFKWIANRAMELEAHEGLRFVMGYEEALGYTIGDVVRDKDGISAAVLFAELAAELRGAGRTVADELERIARTYGLWVSGQVNVVRKGARGAADIQELMASLRAEPVTKVGDLRVVATSDFQARTRITADGEKTPIALPATNMVAFELEDGSRIVARPSGTEPKCKFYFDVREAIREGEPLADAEARAKKKMGDLMAAFELIAQAGTPTHVGAPASVPPPR